jgi:hypothetical protein
MEWPERMNSAIEYIEDNLAGEINIGEAAKRAYCSTFHKNYRWIPPSLLRGGKRPRT